LAPLPETLPILQDLFERYSRAVTRIALWGRDHHEADAIKLHHALYYSVRQELGLPANLVVTALRRASGALKSARLRGKFLFRSTFVALDERTFTLFLDREQVSISTPQGRMRIQLLLGSYQRLALRSGEIKGATLVRTKDGYWANITVRCQVEPAPSGSTLGVDLGIRHLAATSTGLLFSGASLLHYRQQRLKVRASLQSHGTRGTKSVLRRLSGREARRAQWENHRISKRIVEEARRHCCSRIALEDLSGIRERLMTWNPHQNRMLSTWSYGELRDFIRYKAAMSGIDVVEVPAYLSSQTCAECGKRGARRGEVFHCAPCGRTAQADLNAARVIAARGAAVNRPELDGKDRRWAS